MMTGRPLGSIRVYDVLAAASLMVALGFAIVVDRSMAKRLPAPPATTLDVEEVAALKRPIAEKPLRLAVTPPVYDDMGVLLHGLGKGYAYDDLPMDKLLDAGSLKPYNVVFFTCGGVPESWLGAEVGVSQRGDEIHNPNMEVFSKLRDALRAFVSEGGTLYASDLRYNQIAMVFPEFCSPTLDKGKPQTVQAEVVIPELAKLLGSTVPLEFDKPEWCPAGFAGEGCEVLLKGKFENMEGKQCESPLMVRFHCGKGTVIFTSFHNEKTQGEVAEKLLRFLVFAAVTAESESFVTKQSADDGFQRSSPGTLIGAPKVGEPIEHNYECSGSPAKLRYALVFSGGGARLRLKITDPQGLSFEKDVTSTFMGDVRNPANGHWTYSVTPLELPYENFPFSV